MMFALVGAALVATAPSVAGFYEIDQMEMAGGLELRPNGHFRYAFDYGAVSEEAEGRWVADGDGVVLTTDPMPPAAECDRGFATACFHGTRLSNDEGGKLILNRWDARIVLKPVQPLPR